MHQLRMIIIFGMNSFPSLPPHRKKVVVDMPSNRNSMPQQGPNILWRQRHEDILTVWCHSMLSERVMASPTNFKEASCFCWCCVLYFRRVLNKIMFEYNSRHDLFFVVLEEVPRFGVVFFQAKMKTSYPSPPTYKSTIHFVIPAFIWSWVENYS